MSSRLGYSEISQSWTELEQSEVDRKQRTIHGWEMFCTELTQHTIYSPQFVQQFGTQTWEFRNSNRSSFLSWKKLDEVRTKLEFGKFRSKPGFNLRINYLALNIALLSISSGAESRISTSPSTVPGVLVTCTLCTGPGCLCNHSSCKRSSPSAVRDAAMRRTTFVLLVYSAVTRKRSKRNQSRHKLARSNDAILNARRWPWSNDAMVNLQAWRASPLRHQIVTLLDVPYVI